MRSLLPGGERGSRLAQLGFVALVIWLGYQGLINTHRFSAVEGNLHSLGDELNTSGEAAFRRDLVRALGLNDVPVTPQEIAISVDHAAHQWVIAVPCHWSLSLLGEALTVDHQVVVRIPRSDRWTQLDR
jgi:hypothetical protein